MKMNRLFLNLVIWISCLYGRDNQDIRVFELSNNDEISFSKLTVKQNEDFNEVKEGGRFLSSKWIKVQVPKRLIQVNSHLLINESKIFNSILYFEKKDGIWDSTYFGIKYLNQKNNGLYFYDFPILKTGGDSIQTFYIKPDQYNINRRFPIYILDTFEVKDLFFKKQNYFRTWIVFMTILFCINLLLFAFFKNKLFWLLSLFSLAILFNNGSRNSNFYYTFFDTVNNDLSIYFRIIGLFLLVYVWHTLLKKLYLKSRLLDVYVNLVSVLLFVTLGISILKIQNLTSLIGIMGLITILYFPLSLYYLQKRTLSSYLKNLRLPLMIFIFQMIFVKVPIFLGWMDDMLLFNEFSFIFLCSALIIMNAVILRFVLEEKERNSFIEDQNNEKLAMKLHDEVSPLFVAAKAQFEMGNRVLSKYYLHKADELMKSNITQKQIRSHWEVKFYELFSNYESLGLNIQKDIVFKDLFDIKIKDGKIEQVHLILQELLTNTYKYAQCNSVKIKIQIKKNEFLMYYYDDGVGMDLKEAANGVGLKHIKKRAESINAFFKIKSKPNKGVKCMLTFKI